MEVKLPFGNHHISMEAPSGSTLIEPRHMPGIDRPEEAMVKALRSPMGTPPLAELARKKESVSIVINDITRPAPSRLMLETLLQELASGGIPDEAVTVVIANGHHRATTPEELGHILGKDLLRRLRIVNHDSMDEANLVYFGTTERGLPVHINRFLGQADLKILTGIITPHQVAGYSGGRKSAVPGVAGFETIRRHHSPPLRLLEPVMGRLRNNPFHEEAVAGAKLVGIDFVLNVVKNTRGEITSLVAGDLVQAHEQGVKACEAAWKTAVRERYDIAVVSPGNFPKDIDLHQAQKAIAVAEQVTARGGVIILVAECRDGVGKFRELMKSVQDPQEIIDRFIAVGFTKDHSSKAFLCARALVNHKVIVVCRGIPATELEAMFFESAPSVEAALTGALKFKGSGAKVLFMPHATDCVPVVEDV
jgi:lactate racemase